MASFALTMRSRPVSVDSILLILDERRDADEIAFEMRRRGHDVEVRELRGESSSGHFPRPGASVVAS
jgi:hypothetical protein